MKKDKNMIQFKEDGPFAVPRAGDGSGYAIVGVGSAGVNIVDHLVLENSTWKNVFAFDADDQKIRGSVAPHKHLMGRSRLRGLGTGGDRDLGVDLALWEMEAFLGQMAGIRTVIFAAGLGGGTATGLLPVWTRELRQRGVRTIVLASTPFEFEGRRRRDLATAVLADLQRECDLLLTFSNGRLLHLPESKEDIREVFRHMNALMGRACTGIQRLVCENGTSPLSLSEMRDYVGSACLENCWVGSGSASGPDRIDRALEQVMASPLLEDGDAWKLAESALLSVVAGPDFTVSEYHKVVKSLQALIPVDIPVRGSATMEAKAHDRLQITVLLSAGSGDIAQADTLVDKADEIMAGVPELDVLEDKGQEEESVAVEPADSLFRLDAEEEGETPQRYFARQEELPLDQRRQRGIFENTEPTMVDGEDLDVPTFMRLNMKIKV
ncbi:MAG: hypothetical protein SFU85_12935 [Candidatus Methylacidiphilales bacterium]|nr:hypothetical protein [Candidatus Methylacidiphilales bacterium]